MEVILKKIILKYLMMYLPFVLGGVLFSVGSINLFSSLLFFVGGYIAIKNTLDFRLVKRNIDKLKEESSVGLDENLLTSSVSKESKLLGNNISVKNEMKKHRGPFGNTV